MKKIVFLVITLIVVMTAWGSVVIVYASSPVRASIVITPTAAPIPPTPQPTSQPTQQTIADNATPVAALENGVVIGQGSDNLAEVALTFDDGPSIYTPQILDILQANSVHASFFCVGNQVQGYASYVQREYSAGNSVGNHTWDHADLTTLSSSDVQSEISKTSDIIQQTIGVTPTLFRPPYGAINSNVKSQIALTKLTPVLWSIDTQDWTLPGSDAIVTRVLSQVGNGDIILLHDGGGDRSQTVAALPQIIQGLRAHGLQLVTVPQLINDSLVH